MMLNRTSCSKDEANGEIVFFCTQKDDVKAENNEVIEKERRDMTEHAKWQWQQEGTSWKGIGIYHVTLTEPTREALLGTLVIPNNDPAEARVEQTELGRALLACQRSVPIFHPEIQILQYCLMPDHLHSIWYVRSPMKESIRYVAQGFWRAAKKAGRAYSYIDACLTGRPMNERAGLPMNERGLDWSALSSLASADSRRNPLRELLDGDTYSHLSPIFTEVPFIRPLSRKGQLQTMIRYVQMNPERLATKRLKPGYFRVQKDIEIGGRRYDGVGNVALLTQARYDVVHVRSAMVEEAKHGDASRLRDYMNSRVLLARSGVVMVSPFISPQEKQVQQVLMCEGHPIICLTDNGFRDYYKPADSLFEACAAGRLLILSPWPYDAGKRHISRADCVALNAMAEEICKHLSTS